MDLSHLNPLPEWEDRFQNIDKGEDWKWKEELQIAKKMYNQWREVFGLVMAFVKPYRKKTTRGLVPGA